MGSMRTCVTDWRSWLQRTRRLIGRVQKDFTISYPANAFVAFEARTFGENPAAPVASVGFLGGSFVWLFLWVQLLYLAAQVWRVYEPGPISFHFTLVFLLLCPCFIFFGLILVITGLVDREVHAVGTSTSSCSTLNLTQEKTWIDKIPLFGLQIRMNWQDDILRKNS